MVTNNEVSSDEENELLNRGVQRDDNEWKELWLNQSIILDSDEMKLLQAKGFKYIPREFFGQELREAAE